ncbi:hypothetical protein [Elizabethkingia bruuniana]|uniref:hypothetical protein n=1 Tax=Elizabethkingia bruuniana TaxID=1756149 RepID=UPI00241D81A9|nr:hypothetical protein [Elizabethkingia bruuniana]
MKNLLKTFYCLVLMMSISSCFSVPTTYSDPLEPGQTVFQRQGDNRYNNRTNNNVPEPGQTEMKPQRNNNYPETEETDVKSENENNIPEPGQTKMKEENED